MSITPSQHELELAELAAYLEGVADTAALSNANAARFARASHWLGKLKNEGVCCDGFIGCKAGARCTSDHK